MRNPDTKIIMTVDFAPLEASDFDSTFWLADRVKVLVFERQMPYQYPLLLKLDTYCILSPTANTTTIKDEGILNIIVPDWASCAL